MSLQGKTFAAIGIAGQEFDDFVAEVRVAPIKGDGYVAVQSRVGTTACYAVRVLPFAGTLSITRAPRGRHDIRDETQLSAPFLRMPIVRPGTEIVFTGVQRGPDLVVYLDGAEAARAWRATAWSWPLERWRTASRSRCGVSASGPCPAAEAA